MAKTRLRRGQLEQLQSLRVMGNTSGSTADVTEVVVLDEDNMASDSATALATQQSVKAYVDAQLTAQDLDFVGDSGGAQAVDLDSQSLTIAGGTNISTAGSGQTLTVNLDATVHNAALKIGRDADNIVDFGSVDDNIIFRANGSDRARINNAKFAPEADSAIDLGQTDKHFKDLFIDAIEIGAANDTDTTITRLSAGDIGVEGNRVYRAGGADIPVADGGTGASTHTAGQVLLGNGANPIQSRAIGISDDNIVEIDSSSVGAGEYGRFTANGLESLTTAEVLADLSGDAGAAFSMANQKITSLALPTADGDAASKAYVDSVAEGLDVKKSVLCATTANITDNNLNYDNDGGTGLVGTLTAQNALAQSTIVIDDMPVTKIGQRVLFKDLVDPDTRNGIYEMTTVGVGGKASSLKIRVMGNYSTISANSTLAFNVDNDGAGGAETYTITFVNGGSSSTAFSNSRTANIRLDAGLNNEALAGEIQALFLSSAQFQNRSWEVSDVEDDSGGKAVKLTALRTGVSAYDFASVTANVGGASEIFGTAEASDTSTGLASAVFTRAADCNNLASEGDVAEFGPGHFTFTEQGQQNADSGFVCVTDDAIPFQNNEIKIAYSQFSGAGSFSGVNGVERDGSSFKLNISTVSVQKNADIHQSDRIAIADSADSNATKYITFANVAGKLDGAGLTALNGVLSVDGNQDGQITSATGLTAVGTLNAGAISSGFGAIDTGASNITTTGLITGGSLDIDDVLINGAAIGHTADTDLITLANQSVALANDVDFNVAKAGGLQIAGAAVTASAAELNLLDNVAGLVQADFTKLAAVDSTAAELNLLDHGVAIGSSITIADADGILIHNADGGMEKVPASDIKAYIGGGTVKVISQLTADFAAASNDWTTGNGRSALPTGFHNDNGDKTELYLNGQLLCRGINQGANKDYYVSGSSIRFNFDLENEDVVQMIKRP